jgi:hypothetical protein
MAIDLFVGIAVAANYLFWILKSLFDGDDKVSTW